MSTPVTFSFDIGHSSIGWAAIQATDSLPQVLGCGAVTFSPDDCQNHQRAAFRRQRRHVAATRNRMKRLEKLLVHLGALSEAEKDDARKNPHPWPWLLAAKILGGHHESLTWPELWAVIRWYAHNRGYDGNALWVGGMSNEDDQEDTRKVENANALMAHHGTQTMAETICAFLGVDPASPKKPALAAYFKGQDAAFPREIVRNEVLRVLKAHCNRLPGCNEDLIECLCGTRQESWKQIACPGIRLPKRYRGGLLFGQMVPRFDNRIIPLCRISDEKTPAKHCGDFYRYRWGMLLCNVRVLDALGESRTLSANERKAVHAEMEVKGYLTKTGFKHAVEAASGATASNADQMFVTPEMEKALVLDPVKRELASQKLADIWPMIPDSFQKRFAGQLFKGKPASLARWRRSLEEASVDLGSFDEAVQASYDAYAKRSRKKAHSFETFCDEKISIAAASGRAPYSRPKMKEAWAAVFADSIPDPKDSGGCLEETPEVVLRQLERSIDEQTNNHLVRHRLLIFRRLLDDMVRNYADDDIENISHISLEVIRDLQEFSAKTAKEKAQLMGLKLADHRRAVAEIEKELPKYGGKYTISAGLIKKVRIARDLNWTCPFTGKHYCFDDIVTGQVDREHIIPRSWRPSDSLDSLVLTWSEVNRMKGQRTAWEFIEADQNKVVPGRPQLQIQTLHHYEKLIHSLKPGRDPRGGIKRDYIDDDLRRWRRKSLLFLPHFDKRKKSDGDDSGSGFTGRDLTQTSHLNKLAALQARDLLKKKADDGILSIPAVTSLAGSVTAAVRKAWKLQGCLTPVCPEADGKHKSDLREITHLHHALDAVSIGLAAYFFPKNGRLWELMSRRQIKNPADQKAFNNLARQTVHFSENGSWNITDLPPELKNQITERLAECRVVQHQPKTMRGLKVQQNTWRVLEQDEKDEQKMVITMVTRDENQKRQRSTKTERKTKLHGLLPTNADGKLKRLKGAIIIEENYGVMLDPEIRVLPHRNVYNELKSAQEANGGIPSRVIRGGSLIKIEEGRYRGTWKVFSIKDAKAGFLIDMATPERVKAANKTQGCVMNALLKTLLNNKLTILNPDLTGKA